MRRVVLQVAPAVMAITLGATGVDAEASNDATDVLTDNAFCQATGRLDPEVFFDQLVERYRRLDRYVDEVVVCWQTISDATPEDVDEVRLTMDCTASDGALSVQTSGGTLWRRFGINIPFRPMPGARRAAMESRYYLAPHMALMFSEDPREQLHADVDRPLVAHQVSEVMIDDRRLVQLDLAAGEATGATDNTATVDDTREESSTVSLYINPESMLVERVDRHESFGDGRSQRTTLDITPTEHEDVVGDPVKPVEPTVAPTDDPWTAPPLLDDLDLLDVNAPTSPSVPAGEPPMVTPGAGPPSVPRD